MAKPKFSRREWTFIAIGLAVLICAPVYFAAVRPLKNTHMKSVRNLASAQDRLLDAALWHDEFVAAQSGAGALEDLVKARSPRFDLWSYVNDKCKEAGINDRAEVEKKRGGASTGKLDAVELKLSGVSMEELVNLLHKTSSDDALVVVNEMGQLVPAPDGKGLNCSVSFVTPKL